MPTELQQDVGRLWSAHFQTTWAALGGQPSNYKDAVTTGAAIDPELDAVAARLADEATRRDVGVVAWQRFTSDRAQQQQRRRPEHKRAPGTSRSVRRVVAAIPRTSRD